MTHFTYKKCLGYERCEDKGETSTKFVPSSTYKDDEETLKAKQIPYLPNPKPSFNAKRAQVKPFISNPDGVYICIFCGHKGYMDEFCFRHKRMEKRCVDYAKNSYHDEFIDFSPHISSRALCHFLHGYNHRSYGFGS
jgi:hypothetical protein